MLVAGDQEEGQRHLPIRGGQDLIAQMLQHRLSHLPGERVILDRPASYAKPLVTPSGREIVFSVRHRGAVIAIRWDGSHRRRVADGFGLAVWRDPQTAHEWVYVGSDERPTDPPSYGVVHRYRLDDPAQSELVWDAQPVSGDSFQLSADGRYAAGLFPWPTVGVADLRAGSWRQLGDGCWTGMSGDEEHAETSFIVQEMERSE